MLFVLGTAEIFTPIVEGAAAAVGSGVVLGGFGAASAGLLNGWSRKQVEGDSLRDGYFGAVVALTIWLLDPPVHRLRYIDMNDIGFRDIWLSLAITLPIGAVGLFFLREDPQAKGMFGLGLLFFGVFLRHKFYNRELRKHEQD